MEAKLVPINSFPHHVEFLAVKQIDQRSKHLQHVVESPSNDGVQDKNMCRASKEAVMDQRDLDR